MGIDAVILFMIAAGWIFQTCRNGLSPTVVQHGWLFFPGSGYHDPPKSSLADR